MDQEKTKTEKRAIKIVDGYITVEVVRREKQPSDKGKVRKPLRILKGKNGRMEQRASAEHQGQTG
jgi:hypothetical protein